MMMIMMMTIFDIFDNDSIYCSMSTLVTFSKLSKD
jgi:hypothetical protein